MIDKSKLVSSGSAVINAATNTVTLTHGGRLQGADGNTVTTYAAGATATLSGPVIPLTIHPNNIMSLPPGYLVPTQPSPYVQLPYDK